MASYYHYFSFGLTSYIDRLLVRVREEVFRVFETVLQPHPDDSILDVGASADDHISSNHFEKRYKYTSRICALGIDHLPGLLHQFPGITVLQGDARALPFADASFDFVYSHAVIEHVGSSEQQAAFLNEALRVARKGVLLTTPNRWHPVETHTGTPLLHYLPSAMNRAIYRRLGKGMYASEETLNLLSSRQMLRLVGRLKMPVREISMHGVRWLGITSNLILVIRKNEVRQRC
jgi:ubiquinone/menaquinone biosynthesis C-methylase UbiE